MRHSLSSKQASKISLTLSLVAAMAFPQIGSAAVIFSDDFNAGTPGANLNGAAVQYSSVGAKTWSSHSVYQGGSNTFATNGGNGYIAPSSGNSSQQASIATTLGQDTYTLSAQFLPLGSNGDLRLGFWGTDNSNFLWQSGKTVLSLQITAGGSWKLTRASNGQTSNDVIILGSSGSVFNLASYSQTTAPVVSLSWNTINNTVTGQFDNTVLFSNFNLGSTISSNWVNYVGFGRDGNLASGVLVDNFSFGNIAAVPVPAAAWLFGSGLLGLLGLKRQRQA